MQYTVMMITITFKHEILISHVAMFSVIVLFAHIFLHFHFMKFFFSPFLNLTVCLKVSEGEWGVSFDLPLEVGIKAILEMSRHLCKWISQQAVSLHCRFGVLNATLEYSKPALFGSVQIDNGRELVSYRCRAEAAKAKTVQKQLSSPLPDQIVKGKI